MMKFLVLLTLGFVQGNDFCAELCRLDGRAICTEGSKAEKDGKCTGYRFKTDPPNGEICYRGKPNKEACPRTGKRITNADAERIVRLRQGGAAATTVQPAPTTIPVVPKTKKGLSPVPPKAKKTETSVIITSPSGERYTLQSKLGDGSQGAVFLGVRQSDNRSFAVKRLFQANDPAAVREVETLRLLRGQHGFPQLIDEFVFEGLNYIVMQRLGRSLTAIRMGRHGSSIVLPPAVGGAIGLQMIDRMQTLHDLGLGHYDLYHYNTNMGLDENRFQLFLIDFGRAMPLSRSDNGRADVRSLAHSILRILNPRTVHKRSISNKASLPEVCEGLPRAVVELFRYAYETLRSQERPDYEFLRRLMRELAPEYDGTVPLE